MNKPVLVSFGQIKKHKFILHMVHEQGTLILLTNKSKVFATQRKNSLQIFI